MITRDFGIALLLWAIAFALASRPDWVERIRQLAAEAFKIFIR